jgi:hypothetical protein
MVTRLSLPTLVVCGLLALAVQAAPASAASCAPGATDKPDLGFVDSNCDGIDGDKAAALFVAPTGNDNNDGSFGHPKATVAAAVTAALAAGKDVYVAAGTYDGKPAFLGSNGHIGVYGGYDAQTWQRSAANVTTLQAPGQVVGVAVPGIVLQLLTVHSLPGGTTSYGVRAFNSDASVALSRVTVQSSAGANGADGAAAPAAPGQAPSGSQGTETCGSVGAAGGQGGGALAGGYGGAFYDTTMRWTGHDGQGEGTISGGMGGQDAEQHGMVGDPGHQGSPGTGGSNALNRVALFFQAMAGADGTAGTRGGGGGGGAGSNDPCLVGSGGGSGGLPGVGGKGGQGGGGSIGVFAGTGSHVLVLDGSVIHTADGGKGGLGVAGQPGGKGGVGGPAGVYSINGYTSHSGAGGPGGYGGQGGQGGGGAGGASVGVLAVDSRALVSGDATITVGSGGPGGIGAYDGAAGVAQKAAQVTTAGGSTPADGDFDGDGVADGADACPAVAGTNGGCPAVVPDGPVAGDPAATAPATGDGTSGGSGSTASSAVSVSVLPAATCVRKAVFRIRINARRAHLRSARLTLDGHRLKLVKGRKRWTARVDLRHSARATHTLVIRGRLRSGRRFKQTRHYLTCGATS